MAYSSLNPNMLLGLHRCLGQLLPAVQNPSTPPMSHFEFRFISCRGHLQIPISWGSLRPVAVDDCDRGVSGSNHAVAVLHVRC